MWARIGSSPLRPLKGYTITDNEGIWVKTETRCEDTFYWHVNGNGLKF